MGFYTKYSPEEAMEKCKKAIEELLEKCESDGIKNYTFAPETTGKKSQFGSLEELINICQSFDNFAPTVDFAHMHARFLEGALNPKKIIKLYLIKLKQN